MIYACDNCHFLFQSEEWAQQCPDCGKWTTRFATEEEKAELEQRLREQNTIWATENA